MERWGQDQREWTATVTFTFSRVHIFHFAWREKFFIEGKFSRRNSCHLNAIITRLSHAGGPGLSGKNFDPELSYEIWFGLQFLSLSLSPLLAHVFFLLLHKYSLMTTRFLLLFLSSRASLVPILTFQLFEPNNIALKVLIFISHFLFLIVILTLWSTPLSLFYMCVRSYWKIFFNKAVLES